MPHVSGRKRSEIEWQISQHMHKFESLLECADESWHRREVASWRSRLLQIRKEKMHWWLLRSCFQCFVLVAYQNKQCASDARIVAMQEDYALEKIRAQSQHEQQVLQLTERVSILETRCTSMIVENSDLFLKLVFTAWRDVKVGEQRRSTCLELENRVMHAGEQKKEIQEQQHEAEQRWQNAYNKVKYELCETEILLRTREKLSFHLMQQMLDMENGVAMHRCLSAWRNYALANIAYREVRKVTPLPAEEWNIRLCMEELQRTLGREQSARKDTEHKLQAACAQTKLEKLRVKQSSEKIKSMTKEFDEWAQRQRVTQTKKEDLLTKQARMQLAKAKSEHAHTEERLFAVQRDVNERLVSDHNHRQEALHKEITDLIAQSRQQTEDHAQELSACAARTAALTTTVGNLMNSIRHIHHVVVAALSSGFMLSVLGQWRMVCARTRGEKELSRARDDFEKMSTNRDVSMKEQLETLLKQRDADAKEFRVRLKENDASWTAKDELLHAEVIYAKDTYQQLMEKLDATTDALNSSEAARSGMDEEMVKDKESLVAFQQILHERIDHTEDRFRELQRKFDVEVAALVEQLKHERQTTDGVKMQLKHALDEMPTLLETVKQRRYTHERDMEEKIADIEQLREQVESLTGKLEEATEQLKLRKRMNARPVIAGQHPPAAAVRAFARAKSLEQQLLTIQTKETDLRKKLQTLEENHKGKCVISMKLQMKYLATDRKHVQLRAFLYWRRGMHDGSSPRQTVVARFTPRVSTRADT
eukprot:GEMP01016332.1.p1 GENE.GEMP01016332.1~~GEMP01016332.1.p1  ORF type:complete len:764 (+),score=181.26 GEMP01016332.1:292-2583(+)